MCDRLGVCVASLTNEGYAVVSPTPQNLVSALEPSLSSAHDATEDPSNWVLVTNRSDTLSLIEAVGAAVDVRWNGAGYIGFFPDDIESTRTHFQMNWGGTGTE